MRHTKTQTLGEVLQQYVEALKIGAKLKEVSLVRQWEDVVGTYIANATTNIYIKDKKLFVSLKSSIIRNELLMIRSELARRLNEKSGEEIITEIILR